MAKWIKKDINKKKYFEFKKNNEISDILAYLASIRNVDNIAEYLNVDNIKSEDPFLHKDMDKAVSVIIEEIERNGNICIYGDYDCDGMTATAILYRYIKDVLKYPNISYFIPNRLESRLWFNRRFNRGMFNKT